MAQTPSLNTRCLEMLFSYGQYLIDMPRKAESNLLSAVLSDENLARFNMTFKPHTRKPSGHTQEVRATWRPRRIFEGSTSLENCPTSCETPERKAETITIAEEWQACMDVTNDFVAELCDENSDALGLPVVQRQGMPPMPTNLLMGEEFASLMESGRFAINKRLREILNTASTDFVRVGEVPAAVPLPIDVTSTNADYLRTGALLTFNKEWRKAGIGNNQKIIVVHDQNAWSDAMDLLKISCCNSNGVNNAGLLINDRILNFEDIGFNDDFQNGTNAIMAFVPGTVSLLTENKWIGKIDLAHNGYTWRTTIPDDVYGDKLMWNIALRYKDCDESWQLVLSLKYDLWITPSMYETGHPYAGIKDIFMFDVGTADLCINECPPVI